MSITIGISVSSSRMSMSFKTETLGVTSRKKTLWYSHSI